MLDWAAATPAHKLHIIRAAHARAVRPGQTASSNTMSPDGKNVLLDAVWPGCTACAWAALMMWSLCAGVAAAQSNTQAEPPETPARPDYELLRDEEDWSFFGDRSRANDLWDPVKFMPFGSPRGSYLSLGGEVRQQYERFTNEEWGRGTPR